MLNIEQSKLIDFEIEQLKKILDEREEEIRMMIREWEVIKGFNNFTLNHDEFKNRELRLQNFNKIKSNWFENSNKFIYLIGNIQKQVIDNQLNKWKKCQQLAGNGASFVDNLGKIQNWCETLTYIIWNHWEQIEKVDALSQTDHNNSKNFQNQSKQMLNNYFNKIVHKTFIIEKQPPQVIKTNTRFQSTVRFLVGGFLNIYMTPPTVKVTIVSEAQANNLDKNNLESSGELLHSSLMMEYNKAFRQLTCSFRNMQLRKIKRAEKKCTNSVMDEKFALLFSTTFKIGSKNSVFHVKALSLPIVVIVHGSQEPHAWATVTWDNAFAEPGRVPFLIPNRMPWARVGEVLNMKFRAAVGSELNQEDLRFLAGKVFQNFSISNYDNLLLTFSQFSKDPLLERNFTFWEWFYAILKVTRDHLKDLWNKDNRVIYGFISRKKAEDLLVSRPNGTFLLRYSDSELGCVSIAYVTEDRAGPAILMIKPFNCRDLTIRSLVDRINDLKHLIYLYPDIPKNLVFGKYYECNNDLNSSKNYIEPILVTQVPQWATNTVNSYPNTPQSVRNVLSPLDLTYQETQGQTNETQLNISATFTNTDFNMSNDIEYDLDLSDEIPKIFEMV